MPCEKIQVSLHMDDRQRQRLIKALSLMGNFALRDCLDCLASDGAVDITISEDGSRAWHNLVPATPKEDKP